MRGAQFKQAGRSSKLLKYFIIQNFVLTESKKCQWKYFTNFYNLHFTKNYIIFTKNSTSIYNLFIT